MPVPPPTITRHCSEYGEWEHTSRSPHPGLRPYVRSYEGYVETRMELTRQLEVPGIGAVLIINLGPVYRVHGPGNPRGEDAYGSFVAGLTDAHVVVESTGLSHGLQV